MNGNKDRELKAQAFLRIVQTGLLARAANVRRSDHEREPIKIARYSGTGVFMRIDEAVRAAGRIPSDMSPAAAAEAFCDFCAQDGTSRNVPHWFARHGLESYDYSAVTKPDQFIWIVQTAILADAEKSAHTDPQGKKPGFYDEASIVRIMGEAIRVAQHTPSDLNATEAASDFLSFYVPGMKERKSPPKWCLD